MAGTGFCFWVLACHSWQQKATSWEKPCPRNLKRKNVFKGRHSLAAVVFSYLLCLHDIHTAYFTLSSHPEGGNSFKVPQEECVLTAWEWECLCVYQYRTVFSSVFFFCLPLTPVLSLSLTICGFDILTLLYRFTCYLCNNFKCTLLFSKD